MARILVWDWPVRIGHWLLVGAFALAWLTGDSEAWRLVHVWAGGAMLGVILFRLVWGLIGTRHARFASFVRGPGSVLAYLKGLLAGRPAPAAGHNPAGAWAIIGLLTLGLLAGGSGWLLYQDMGGEWLEELHEGLAMAMLTLVGLHITGVMASHFVHRENLVRAMLTGYKRGAPEEAIDGARPLAAVLLIGWVIACAWWFAR